MFNRIYRLIWSQVLQAWVAVSENTRGRGKQSGSTVAAALSVTAAVLSLVSPFAQAGPEGGQVVSGSGSISASGSAGQSTTTINQTSDKLSINWQSFNVAKAETVNFVQPSASALAVNRIFDTQGSQILGRINANGQVWLINPNGVLFGKDAQINVGGLLASTLNPDDASIGSTRSNFSGSSTASVVNLGSINTTQGGYVAMLGHSVSNQGSISAPGGTVAMGAGSAVSLNFAGSSLLGLEVTSNQVNALAENGGLIRSDGGQVLLSAGARESLLASVVNSTGVIRADTAFEQNGKIVLSGGGSGVVNVTGTLAAAGAGPGLKGGRVSVLGSKVGLSGDALIDVSGDAGGGTALIGGNYLGQGEEQNAQAVFVGANTRINADATAQGDGGKVIVWSDETTRFLGSISARGGSAGGNGGFVETSGKEYLLAEGTVDASAAHGEAGLWLLDPRNVEIVATATTNGNYSSAVFTPTADNAKVSRDTIQNSLNGGTSVTITTGSSGSQAGNITISASITKSAGTAARLTLNAANNISVNNTVSSTSNGNALSVFLNATNATTFSTAGSLSTNGGDVSITGTGTKTLGNINTKNINENDTYGTGNLTIGSAGEIKQNSSTTLTIKGTTTLEAGSGNNITLDKANNNFGGAVSVTSSKDVKLRDDIGTLTLGNAAVSGNLEITTAGALTQSSDTTLTVTGTTTLIAGSNDIKLDNANNDFGGAVSVTSGKDVKLRDDIGTLTLGNAAVSGYLDVRTKGALTGTGALTVTGTTTLTAADENNENPQDITLDNANNNFTGAVSVTSGRNVTLHDVDTLKLGTSTISGDLNIRSIGALTQSSGTTLTVGGKTTLTAADENNETPQDITLNNEGNNFTGAVSVGSGKNVMLRDADALDLGTSTISGDLNITTNGALTQSSGKALTVEGTTTLAAGEGNDITLGNFNDGSPVNNFVGPVSVTSGKNVTLSDFDSLDLGTSTVSGTLNITVGGSGNVTQSGAVNAAKLVAVLHEGELNLGSVNDDGVARFENKIDELGQITTPGGFSLTNGENSVIVAGTITAANSTVYIEAGSITDTGVNTITANTVNLKANAGRIGSSVQDGGVDIVANYLSVNTNNANAFLFVRNRDYAIEMAGGPNDTGSSVGSGTLALTTATVGVKQSAKITAGTLNVKSNAAITLDRDDNNAGTVDLQAFNSAAISYNDVNDIFISGINSGAGGSAGAVTLKAGGNVTQTGAGAVKASQLTADLSAGAGALNLAGLGNKIDQLNAIDAPGGFTLNNGNNRVTVAGNITATGTNSAVSIDAGTESYTQNNNIDINAGTGGITITADKVAIGTNNESNAFITSGTLTLKPKTPDRLMKLVSNGSEFFELSTAEITAISRGANSIVIGDAASEGVLTIGGTVNLTGKSLTLNAGSIKDTTSSTITTAETVNLKANLGTIGSDSNPINIAATNLSVNTNNANAFVSTTGAITMSAGPNGNGSSVGSGTLDLTATGAVKQDSKITAGTLNVKTRLDTGAAITLANDYNDADIVNLQTRNAGDNANAAGAIQYSDTDGFDVAAIATTSNVTLSAGGTVTQTGAVNAAQLTATLSAGALYLHVVDNNIAQLNAIDAPGGFTLNNGNNNVTVAGEIKTTNNDVFIDVGTGTYTQNADVDINAGAGNITITADTVAIAANSGNNALTTSGTLTLRPKSAARTMSWAGSSDFDLSTDEITAITTGATGPIVIGDAGSTGVLTIGVAISLAGKTLTLNAGSITDDDTTTRTITADTVNLRANSGTIGSSNTNGSIDIVATNLSVYTRNANGNADAFVRATGDIIMAGGPDGAGSSVGGTLDLTATGTVSQTGKIIAGTLNVKAITALSADDSAITLENADNEVGKVNLQALDANDVNANSPAAIRFINATGFEITGINNERSDGTVGNVYLEAGDDGSESIGDVTQTGAIKAAQLSANVRKGMLNLINLNGVNNKIAQLGDITARDGFALNNGNNAVEIIGTITNIDPEKAISISTGSGAITFGESGSIASNGGNVTLSNSTTIDMALGNINTMHDSGEGEGNLTITSERAVSQLGSTVLTIQGTTSIAAGEGYDVTLNSAGNDFKAVSVTRGNNVTLRDKNDKLTLGTTTITGKLTIDAVGEVTQTGAITAAELSANLSAGALYLHVVDNNIAQLNDITAPEGFRLTNGNNALVINGAITVTDAENAVDINTGSGALTFGENGSIVSGGGNVTLINTSTDQMVLGTIDTKGAYDGHFTIESKGAISQHESTKLTIRGETKIKIASGASDNDSVTLANADNDFDADGMNGFVSVKSGNDVTLRDANELKLGAFNVGGKLEITAVGTVLQYQDTAVSAAELTANAGALFLTRAGNKIDQLNTINTPGGFTLKNGNNDLTLAGNITVTADNGTVNIEAGSIKDKGEQPITAVTVRLKANKDGGQIGSSGEDGRIDIAARNLTIETINADAFVRTTGAINIGLGGDNVPAYSIGANVGTGTLDLTAKGAVKQDSKITAGTLNVKTLADGVAGAIKLEDGQNDVDMVNFQTLNAAGGTTVAADISYTNKTGFEITGINKDIKGIEGKAGNVTLQAGGNVTQTAAGAVNASQLTATLSAGSLNLDRADNNIAQLNTITTPGGFTLTNGNNGVIVAGEIKTTNNAVFIDVGTGSYTQNNVDISAGAGNITVVADTVAIGTNTNNNAFATSGTLTLKPKTQTRAMTLSGSGSSNGFDLSSAEITAFSGENGATNSIVIGDTGSTGVLTIGDAVNLAGKSLTLNAGSITDGNTMTRIITATNVTLKANNANNANSGTIGSSNTNGSIDIVATNLSVYTRNANGNADAFVRATGDIIMAGGPDGAGSSVGGTLDLTATGTVSQTGKITAGTLNVKALNADGAAIDLDDAANEVNKVNLQTRNGAAISYKDATGFEITGINNDSDTRGNVTLLAGGNVTQTGAVKAAELTADLSAGALTLDRTDNNIVQLNTIITPGGFTLKNGDNNVTVAGNITAANNRTVDIEAGSITDTGVNTITAGTVNLKANVGRIGSSVADGGIDNGIDIAATNLSVNTSNNANAFVRATGDINIGVGNSGSSVGEGTLDLTATGAVNQSAEITAGTLNVKTLAAGGAAITLTNDNNEVGKVNLQTLNGAAISYTDATGFEITGINTGINSVPGTGKVTLKAGGNVTQTGAIKANGLALTGTNVDYTLENEDNAVKILAADTGSVSYKQSDALAVGTVNGVSGVTTTGTIKIETTGIDANLTLNNAVTSSEATGDAIILRAGSSNAAGVSDGGQLINEAGPAGIHASKGRYLVYSGDPDNTDEFVTGYAKRYNIGVIQPQNPGDPDETFVPTGTKSTFIYRRAPTIRVFANGGQKYYDGLAPDLTFSLDGLIDDDAAGTALKGALERRGGKNVLGGDDVLQGTLAAQMGYGLEYYSGTYNIYKKPITVTATQVSKTYDGTITATGSATVGDLAGAESVHTKASLAFTDKNAGSNKTVRASGLKIKDSDGADVTGNYDISYIDNTSSTISKAALTVTAAQVSKTYDGSTTATGDATVGTLAGEGAGEEASTTASLAFTDKNAGSNKTVRASGLKIKDSDGADVTGNYDISYIDNTTSTISKAALSVTAAQVSKTYDGSTTASGDAAVGTLAGRDAGEEASTTASLAFTDKNAGSNKTVRASGLKIKDSDGADVTGNYDISYIDNTSSTISKKAITLSGITAANKTYDGRETATVLLDKADFNGKVSGDDLKVISSSGSFADKNAGTDKTVNLTNELGGNDLGNYTIAEQKTTTAKIDKANLTEVSASKTYDGLRTVKAQEMGVIKGVNGERFTARAGTADISDENVATANKTLTNLSGLELTGVDGGNRDNYNLDSGLPTAGDNNRVVIIERVTTPTSTSTQSVFTVPLPPVINAPPLPSDTSYVKAPLLSQNRPSFSWSLFFNRLFEEGAATVGNFVKQAPQVPAVKLTDELADNESQAGDSVGGDSTNSPSSSAPGASSGDTSSGAGSRKVNGFQNVVLQTNQRSPIQNKQR